MFRDSKHRWMAFARVCPPGFLSSGAYVHRGLRPFTISSTFEVKNRANFGPLTTGFTRLMFTRPKWTLRMLRRLMQLHSPGDVLRSKIFNPWIVSPVGLRRRAASRWALSHISSFNWIWETNIFGSINSPVTNLINLTVTILHVLHYVTCFMHTTTTSSRHLAHAPMCPGPCPINQSINQNTLIFTRDST